jgi:hypothetical protein
MMTQNGEFGGFVREHKRRDFFVPLANQASQVPKQ